MAPTKPKCGAKTQSGGECQHPAGYKTDHVGYGRCYRHGGANPNGKKSAQRIAAREAVVTYGLPVDVEPMEALAQELRRTAGHVAWLGSLIASLPHEDVAADEVSLNDGVPRSGLLQYTLDKGMLWQKPSVWVELYAQERKHLVDVSATLVRLGFAEREVRILEFQAAAFVGALRSIFTDLGMLDDPRVPDVVERRLRELSTAEAPSRVRPK